MEVKAKIVKMLPEVKGTSQNGTDYRYLPVVIEWQELARNGQFYTQQCKLELGSGVSEKALAAALNTQTEIDIHLSINVREYKDKVYNDIKGYLPSSYYEKQ